MMEERKRRVEVETKRKIKELEKDECLRQTFKEKKRNVKSLVGAKAKLGEAQNDKKGKNGELC